MDATEWEPGHDAGPVVTGRAIAAGALVIALAVIAIITVNRAAQDVNGQSQSAVQVIQVYAEGAFWAIVAIGIGLAAYIGSRSGE